MIIRRLGSTDLLISQPEHAALAARIMRQGHSDHFPDPAEGLDPSRCRGARLRVVSLKGQVSGALPSVAG